MTVAATACDTDAGTPVADAPERSHLKVHEYRRLRDSSAATSASSCRKRATLLVMNRMGNYLVIKGFQTYTQLLDQLEADRRRPAGRPRVPDQHKPHILSETTPTCNAAPSVWPGWAQARRSGRVTCASVRGIVESAKRRTRGSRCRTISAPVFDIRGRPAGHRHLDHRALARARVYERRGPSRCLRACGIGS